MQALKEKQELQRELEVIEKGKAELSRKLELLDAKTKMQRTEMELMLEQSVEEETDGMNDYLKEYYMQNQLKKELLSQPDELTVTPNSEAQPANGQETMAKGLPTVNGAQSQFVLPSAQKSLGTESVVTLSSVSHTVQVAKNEESINRSTSVTPTYCMDGMITSCLSRHLPYSKTTPTACTPNSIQLPIYTHASLSPVITQSTPGIFTQFHVPHATSLRAAATEYSPAITSQWTMPSPSRGPSLLSQSQTSPQFSEQSDAWLTIAQAIKQGPSLPKVELAKFSGDPLEYAEFVTNFKDNIESQVADESQRLTRLLTQCIGKAREAIRSCVNLPVGHRYSEAWKTLHENFGQSHMIVEAHMKKLRDIQVRKADASTLMDFARRLEDARRVLTSMGSNYTSRLDNEDLIIMLMRKLPDESLKRKWADRAGDLMKSKGRAEYADFVSFIKRAAERINNRYGQELKPFSSTEREKKESGRVKSDYPHHWPLQVTRLSRAWT